MVGNISNKISLYFQNQLNLDEENREVIEYGSFVVIGGCFKIIMLIILGLLFGVLKYALIISTTFALFRTFSGGVHANTYKGCMILTMTLFIGSSMIVKLCENNINYSILILFIALIIIYSMYSIIRFAPKDTPNRIISDEKEKKKFKKITVYLFILYTCFMFGCLHYEIEYTFVLAGFIGIFIQMILLHPIAYRTINRFDNILKRGI
ncbi:accessory gene regulator ArgB-like protein [Tepidibacter aestuarii]|uniref:accessory gene regulator ArgB-like protein n=1 Tax=Tepidibacter aestuarii TaxID=2925782 RepID=UPI0020BF7074|nr:accessory gene regulator B family protein [Tepidibacter aestuarii]CAH2212348.1 accessory gene regulator B [Tepidibacter aestuarii]